jgi:hypothetical protein
MEVKGTTLRTLLEAIEKELGPSVKATVLESLPPEARATLTGPILATSFYPIALVAALHESLRRGPGSSVRVNRRVGAAAARLDFGGVYRVFIAASDVRSLLDRMSRAWRQYNSRGRVSWELVEEGYARGTISDVEGYTEAMWTSIAGRVEGVLTMKGSKRPTAQILEWSSESCAIEVRWG